MVLELVLKDNNRSLEEKQKGINDMKNHLNALKNSVSMNMRLLLLSDHLTIDEDPVSVKSPKSSPISSRGKKYRQTTL